MTDKPAFEALLDRLEDAAEHREWAKRNAIRAAVLAAYEEAREGWHMANGVADLAVKHRDEAEQALRDAAGREGQLVAFRIVDATLPNGRTAWIDGTPTDNIKSAAKKAEQTIEYAYTHSAPKADAWDRCDACNGTLDDHYAPDGGGCPGFRKHVPPKPGEVNVMNRARDEAAAAGTLYPDIDLVERAVRNARPHHFGKRPRWMAVMDALAVGSTLAHGLCLRFGLDPEEDLDGPECDHCAENEEES